jgi:hypothetical protein
MEEGTYTYGVILTIQRASRRVKLNFSIIGDIFFGIYHFWNLPPMDPGIRLGEILRCAQSGT